MSSSQRTEVGRYKWIDDWIVVPDTAGARANGRTHGVVVSADGRILIFHQATPAVLVYSGKGTLLASWGDYPGAHGMALVEEDGVEYLWLTDQERCTVVKTTLNGEVVATLPPPPLVHPAYREKRYVPTWVAVNETRIGGNGDVWVADGYGAHVVHGFDRHGNHLHTLDGTEGAGRYRFPHGVWFGLRQGSPQLYVADRSNARVQVYDPEGNFVRCFGEGFLTNPDMFSACGDLMLVPELRARLTLLDADDRPIARIGANDAVAREPGWPNDRRLLEAGKFNSPHAAAADAHGNIYVVEWITGGRVVKLEKLPADPDDNGPRNAARLHPQS